jgi:HlyD family secretion protein
VLKKLAIVAVVLVLLLALLGGVGFALAQGGNSVGPAGVSVRTEAAFRGQLVERVTAPGRLEAEDNVQISARVSARILELPFDEGDPVKAGDVLVRLDASDLEANLRAAEARLAAQEVDIEVARSRLEAAKSRLRADEASLAEAERDFERKRNLLETRDISAADFESAEARFTRLRAELDAATTQLAADTSNLRALEFRLDVGRAEIDQAQDTLDDTVITSPIDGVVTRLNAEVGELVITGTMNNAGTVIMEVADLDEMLVRAEVYESDIAQVAEGQAAEVRIDAYRDEVFDGTVKNVALARTTERTGITGNSSNANTYGVDILLDTAGRRLLSDLTADVEVRTITHDNALLVPTQAIRGHATDELPEDVRQSEAVDGTKSVVPVVYVRDAGKAKVRPVRIGPSDLNNTIIELGLTDGEEVIIGPFSIFDQLKNDLDIQTGDDEQIKDETETEEE